MQTEVGRNRMNGAAAENWHALLVNTTVIDLSQINHAREHLTADLLLDDIFRRTDWPFKKKDVCFQHYCYVMNDIWNPNKKIISYALIVRKLYFYNAEPEPKEHASRRLAFPQLFSFFTTAEHPLGLHVPCGSEETKVSMFISSCRPKARTLEEACYYMARFLLSRSEIRTTSDKILVSR